MTIIYDIETFPNCFTFAMEFLDNDTKAVWEVSEFRDDRRELLQFFQWLASNQVLMIGFNNIGFDYPVIHQLWNNPNTNYIGLYDKAMQIIEGNDRFGNTIWADKRFAPQIDLFKLHHLDNKAKSTGLKALQINMRCPNVVDMPVENGKILTKPEIDNYLIPYNQHDVSSTKEFAIHSLDAINFRKELVPQFGIDVLNWNDTKIGEQMIIRELGDNVCYDRSSGKRQMRQTPRHRIDLNDIIFPYVKFENPEFNRILQYLKQQVLKSQDIDSFNEDIPKIETKGVFTDLKTIVGGIEFKYGTGGLHGSLENKRILATDEWLIRDIDVASLYPSIAIKNNLAPEHLGNAFVKVYSQLPIKRKDVQAKKGKKCTEANSYKLASNGAYGKSNSKFSPLYDPKFTMSITINGQLLLSMLAEKLINVPTLTLIQCNTDGITYYINKQFECLAASICRQWEELTQLTLEDANYKAMFIRDVNNYVAIDLNGNIKLKGAYWTPDPKNYHKSIAEAQPVSWHKNFSNCVSTRAAVAHMIYGTDVEQFIRNETNPYDFTCAVKIRKSDMLLWDDKKMQRNTRFYVSTDGAPLIKQLPANGVEGAYKKANGVSDSEYNKVMKETAGAWDARVCTKNKSRYNTRESGIVTGFNVTICNSISNFRFDNIDYNFYIQEANKLIIR